MSAGMPSGVALLLWDLLPAKQRIAVVPNRRATQPASCRQSTQCQYDQLVREMKATYHVRVHRWRKRTTGCAWQVIYEDMTSARLIESPYPRGPVSVGVFLHEVGHHAIGFHTYKPRCYEEYKAWQWAFARMRERRIPISDQLRKRYDEAMRYAVAKALRRGIKSIPQILHPFLPEDHPGLLADRLINPQSHTPPHPATSCPIDGPAHAWETAHPVDCP